MSVTAAYLTLSQEQCEASARSSQLARDMFDHPDRFGTTGLYLGKSWDKLCWLLSANRRKTKDIIFDRPDDLVAAAVFGREPAPKTFVDALGDARMNGPLLIQEISTFLNAVDENFMMANWDGRAMVRASVYGMSWATRDDSALQAELRCEFGELRTFYAVAARSGGLVVASVT